MAERRMFSKKLTDSDTFISLPPTTQLLYFHLNQGADDDGFNNQVMIAMIKAKAEQKDLEALLSKNYIIKFDSNVVVITHWKVHNYIQKDRYKKTSCTNEMAQLYLDENNVYTMDTTCIQNVSKMDTQDRLGKDRLGKDSIDKDNINITAEGEAPLPCDEKKVKHKYGLYNNVLLTDSEYAKLCNEFPHDIALRIDELSEYIEIHGKKYKSHLATIRAWARRENKINNNNKENSANRQKGYDIFIEKLIEMRSGG